MMGVRRSWGQRGIRAGAGNGNTWSAVESGNATNGLVTAVATDGQGRVYVGGSFAAVGNQVVNGIAMWDRRSGLWYPLGHELTTVWALAFDANGALYVGGGFNQPVRRPGLVSRGLPQMISLNGPLHGYNTGAWSTLDAGLVHGQVYSLAVDHHNHVYAGGDFKLYCGSNGCLSTNYANGIAMWDNNIPRYWYPLSHGLMVGSIPWRWTTRPGVRRGPVYRDLF